MATTLAPKINGTDEGSFCYITVKERWPKILTKTIDHIHQYQPEAVKLYGELGENNVTWYKAPWLFVECYLYRKIHELFVSTKHLTKFDPFQTEKRQAYTESAQHLKSIAAEMVKDIEQEDLPKGTARLTILRILQVALWGNKCDLSFSNGESHGMSDTIFQELEELRSFILVDDLEKACDKYLMGTKKLQRIDIVLDNAGLEVFTDICLADFLISKNFAEKAVFHGKPIPWFVSDTTLNDFNWVIEQMRQSEDENIKKLGIRWTKLLDEGKFEFKAHRFWTYGYAYCEMKAQCPDLYEYLQKSSFLIFKGDLNYRKLVGDRYWPCDVDFKTALCGFEPTTLLALRTLKAETVAGLSPAAMQKIREKYPKKDDKSWMTSSEYAVVQMLEI